MPFERSKLKHSVTTWARRKTCSRACANKTRARPAIERLLAMVDHSDADACWEWRGARWGEYGRFDKAQAHRKSYELHVGPIPDGMEVCHSCDNPPCINPSHLFLGSHADNMADAKRKKRIRPSYTPGRRRDDCGRFLAVA